MINKVGFGGGCHWCTEAVFQSLKGVVKVEQGWISSIFPYDSFSEAVIVHFNEMISLEVLIEIHLLTHSSTSKHSMRDKYRSAIYFFNEEDKILIQAILNNLVEINQQDYITQVLPFVAFNENKESQLNYYQKNKEGQFCQNYIHPKLALIRSKFSKQSKSDF